MSYKESKLKMYCKKLQQKCFIFPIQEIRDPAQRKYTMKKELLFEGRDWQTRQFDEHYRLAVTENHEYHTLQELVCDNSET